jgi:GAF domain-containing protein
MLFSKVLGNDHELPRQRAGRYLTAAIRSTISDPLVHHGRHFGRAIFAFCSVRSLLTNGLVCMGEAIDPELLSVK